MPSHSIVLDGHGLPPAKPSVEREGKEMTMLSRILVVSDACSFATAIRRG